MMSHSTAYQSTILISIHLHTVVLSTMLITITDFFCQSGILFLKPCKNILMYIILMQNLDGVIHFSIVQVF